MPEKLSEDGLEKKLDTLDQKEAEFHRKLNEFAAKAKEMLNGPNSDAVMDQVISFLTQPMPTIPSELNSPDAESSQKS